MKWCRLGVEGRRRDEEGWGNHGERRKLKWEMRMKGSWWRTKWIGTEVTRTSKF
jgi:hypothetical protein